MYNAHSSDLGSVDDTPLTRGLRRILIAVAAILSIGATALIVGMHSLDYQVQGWYRMEVVDSQREALLDAADLYSRQPSTAQSQGILRSLSQLEFAITETKDVDDGQFATDALAILDVARSSFTESIAQNEVVIAQIQLLDETVARFLRLSQIWAQTLNTQSSEVLRAAEQNEDQVRRLVERRELLTSAMLQAVRLQQQIEATRRLADTTNFVPDGRSILGLDISELPQPCSAEDFRNPQRLCRPNTARVMSSIEALNAAGPDETPALMDAALRSLEAFIRASEAAYSNAAQQQSALLDAAGEVRRQDVQIAARKSNHARVNSIILDIKTLIEREYPIGSGSVEDVERQMLFLVQQLQIRSMALIRNTTGLGQSGPDVDELAGELQTAWAGFLGALKARDAAFVAFDTDMSDLADMISARAASLRSATELWVDVFASVALAAITGLFLVLMSGYFAGRHLIVEPLRQVTSTILALTHGMLDQPIEIRQKRLGFDQLGTALEDLRRGMLERSLLEDRNLEQTETIKSHMRELERTTREMEWLAMHDPTTELGNRRAADAEIQRLSRAGKDTGDFCLVHLDIDNFKDANDTFGHAVGDDMLRHVAEVLKATVPSPDKCYRIGGDEFLIVLTENWSVEQVSDLAHRLLDVLSRPLVLDGQTIRSGISMGIAFGKDTGGDAQSTLVNADFALYEAKRCGRGRFNFFSDQLSDGLRRRKQLGARLVAAIEERRFHPFYQPQFAAGTLAFRGVETLCRWKDPEEGWIAPAQFLDLAEEMQLMKKIDEIMFEAAAADLRYLRSKGFNVPRLSFNVTAQRLAQSSLAQDLRNAIDAGTQVAVELLESMSLDDLTDSMRWSIDSLKDAGVAIEIDDFGSCRASIAGLISVGPDAMKIDKSLVLPLTESDQHLELVRTIVQIGTTLGIEIVAEGVETDAHVTLLSELGCDVLQGYALARPMPIDQLEEFLRQRLAVPKDLTA